MKAAELLGPLEAEVMEVMWEKGQATVREVLNSLRSRRAIAYTTVMTVMTNLAAKELLERVLQGKAYCYTVALSQEEFLARAAQEAVGDVLARFGDLAITRFLERVGELNPADLDRLKQLAEGKDGAGGISASLHFASEDNGSSALGGER